MAKSLTLDQVGSMFASGPVKARQAVGVVSHDTADRALTLRVTVCDLCTGDLYTVLPEEPDDIRPLRFVHAACVGF